MDQFSKCQQQVKWYKCFNTAKAECANCKLPLCGVHIRMKQHRAEKKLLEKDLTVAK